MPCHTFLNIYIVLNKDVYLLIDLEFELQVMTAAFQNIRLRLIFIRVKRQKLTFFLLLKALDKFRLDFFP